MPAVVTPSWPTRPCAPDRCSKSWSCARRMSAPWKMGSFQKSVMSTPSVTGNCHGNLQQVPKPSRRNAGEPPIGPIDDRLRDRRVAEERAPELSLRGERVFAEGARDDFGEVLVRARARAIRHKP